MLALPAVTAPFALSSLETLPADISDDHHSFCPGAYLVWSQRWRRVVWHGAVRRRIV